MSIETGVTDRMPAPLADLLARVAQGDGRSFQRLHRASRARLLDVILRIQPHRPLAEEVLQEVLISIWRHAGDYDARRSQPMTWMAAIARNRAIDSLRRARSELRVESIVLVHEGDEMPALEALASESPGPEERQASLQQRRQLGRVLPLLSARQQLCLSMVYAMDFTQAEVARQTALPLGTVKTLVRRALIELRVRLRGQTTGR